MQVLYCICCSHPEISCLHSGILPALQGVFIRDFLDSLFLKTDARRIIMLAITVSFLEPFKKHYANEPVGGPAIVKGLTIFILGVYLAHQLLESSIYGYI